MSSVSVAGDASSAPRPAQGNVSPCWRSGGSGSAGASTCSQPAAPPPVFSATGEKLKKGRSLEE